MIYKFRHITCPVQQSGHSVLNGVDTAVDAGSERRNAHCSSIDQHGAKTFPVTGHAQDVCTSHKLLGNPREIKEVDSGQTFTQEESHRWTYPVLVRADNEQVTLIIVHREIREGFRHNQCALVPGETRHIKED